MIRQYILSRTVPVQVTPTEAGRIFARFDSTQQAEFFNSLAKAVEQEYDHTMGGLCMQRQYVTDESVLTDAARAVMATIGEYAAKSAPAPSAPSEQQP
jgi:hypothetical protein